MLIKKESLLLGLAGLVLLAAGVFLFMDTGFLSKTTTSTKLIKLAHLKDKKNLVKKKTVGQIVWEEVSTGSDLFKGDELFTHNESTAEVEFKDKALLKLSPNTLVKLDEGSSGIGIELMEGFLFAKVSSKSKKLSIKSANKEIIVEQSTELQINKFEGKAEITVLQGRINLELDGKVIEVKKDQIIETIEDRTEVIIKDIEIRLLTPTRDRIVLVDSEPFSLALGWDASGDLVHKHLFISRDSNFNSIVHKKLYDQNSAQVDGLRGGYYYWKIEGVDERTSKKVTSIVGSFIFLKNMPPTLYTPTFNQMVRAKKESGMASVKFSWENQMVPHYEIEISGDDGSVVNKKTENNQLLIDLAPGDYKWRVRNSSDTKISLDWSDSIELFILDAKVEQPPILLEPKAEQVIRPVDIPDGKVNLSWSFPVGSEFLIEIAKDPEFKTIEFTQKTTQKSFQYSATRTGLFYWRVGLVTDNGKTILSDHSTFYINNKEIELLGPPNSSIIYPKSPKFKIQYSWSDSERAVSTIWDCKHDIKYFLEISKSEDFKKIIKAKKLKENQSIWSEGKLGLFFWRVAPCYLDRPGRFSEPFILEIRLPVLEIPSIDPEFEIEVRPNPNLKTMIQEKKKGRFPSSVEEKIVKNFARFKLPPNENAKEYLIEIFRDENLEHLVIRKKFKKPRFYWKNPPFTKLYLRYAIIDHWGRQSEFSNTSIFSLIPHDDLLLNPKNLISNLSEEFISLSFTKGLKGVGHKVVLAKDDGFSEIIIEKQTFKSKITLKNQAFGDTKVFWKVSYSIKNQLRESEVSTFEIVKPEPPKAETPKVEPPKAIVNELDEVEEPEKGEEEQEQLAHKESEASNATVSDQFGVNFINVSLSPRIFNYNLKLKSGVNSKSTALHIFGFNSKFRAAVSSDWAIGGEFDFNSGKVSSKNSISRITADIHFGKVFTIDTDIASIFGGGRYQKEDYIIPQVGKTSKSSEPSIKGILGGNWLRQSSGLGHFASAQLGFGDGMLAKFCYYPLFPLSERTLLNIGGSLIYESSSDSSDNKLTDTILSLDVGIFHSF